MGILLPIRFSYLPYYLAIGTVCWIAHLIVGPAGLILASVPSWMALVAYHAVVLDKEGRQRMSVPADAASTDQPPADRPET